MVCKQWSLERFVVKTTSPSQPYIWMWPPVTLTKMKLERMALIPCDGSLRAFMRRTVTLTSHFDQIKQQLCSSGDYVINSFTNFSLTSCFCIGYWIIISFYHINCGVQQGFSALRKAVTTHVKKKSYFLTCVDIANQLLTRHSPLAPLGQVTKRKTENYVFSGFGVGISRGWKWKSTTGRFTGRLCPFTWKT